MRLFGEVGPRKSFVSILISRHRMNFSTACRFRFLPKTEAVPVSSRGGTWMSGPRYPTTDSQTPAAATSWHRPQPLPPRGSGGYCVNPLRALDRHRSWMSPISDRSLAVNLISLLHSDSPFQKRKTSSRAYQGPGLESRYFLRTIGHPRRRVVVNVDGINPVSKDVFMFATRPA